MDDCIDTINDNVNGWNNTSLNNRYYNEYNKLYVNKNLDNDLNNNKIISKTGFLQYHLLSCIFCKTNNTSILYKFKKYIICKYCANNQKKIRFFKNIKNESNCDACEVVNTKCYIYNNDLKLCQYCFDNHNKFKKILNITKLYSDSYFYIWPNMVKINYVNLFENKHIVHDGIEVLLNEDLIINCQLDNLLNLVQLKDSSISVPICTSKKKDKYYLFIDLNTKSINYNNIYIIKNNVLYRSYYNYDSYLKLYDRLMNKNEKINNYCLKCKTINCNDLNMHRQRLNIKSIAYYMYNKI